MSTFIFDPWKVFIIPLLFIPYIVNINLIIFDWNSWAVSWLRMWSDKTWIFHESTINKSILFRSGVFKILFIDFPIYSYPFLKPRFLVSFRFFYDLYCDVRDDRGDFDRLYPSPGISSRSDI